ncbi:hypothetical protein CHU95_19095 [Niveispirillum lacus]|uniref:DUF4164 domain-containing protein n=1 Tax=Niveispirillum lacus TaxID=1981099 RepID=A0A255YUF8_9PROT|nr:hypothetical protein [Niveispirillum lacus]OYQ32848.1 hypothetical protein CHU95_19095 [Niveispirillum lacus]
MDSLTAALERLDKSIGLLDRALTRRLERLDAHAGTAGWLAEKLRLEAELAAARHAERQAQEQARVMKVRLDAAISRLQGVLEEG